MPYIITYGMWQVSRVFSCSFQMFQGYNQWNVVTQHFFRFSFSYSQGKWSQQAFNVIRALIFEGLTMHENTFGSRKRFSLVGALKWSWRTIFIFILTMMITWMFFNDFENTNIQLHKEIDQRLTWYEIGSHYSLIFYYILKE